MESWTTKDGKVMLIDDMTETHAKNALKQMVRARRELIDRYNSLATEHNKLVSQNRSNNGIARQFNEDFLDDLCDATESDLY